MAYNSLLHFKFGPQENLGTTALSSGAVYITSDTKKIYLDPPSGDARICLGDFQLVEYATAGGAATALNAVKIKETNILYITVNDTDGTGMWRYDGTTFKALTSTADIAALRADLTALQSTVSTIKPLAENAMPKSGGTFTGNVSMGSGKTLTVNAPTSANHAATKTYVDTAVSNLKGGDSTFTGTVKGAYDAAAAADGKAVAAGTAATNAQSAADKAQEEVDALEIVVGNLTTTVGGKAPTNHAASATTYGVGTDSLYGHLKLSDSVTSTSGTAGGTAATPAAVKAAYDLATSAKSTADGKAPTSHAVNANTYGLGTNGVYGHVKLSDSTADTTSTTSSGVAATPKAVATALSSAKTHAEQQASAVLGTATDEATANTVYGAKAAAAAAQTTASAAVKRAGDTMTGALTLSGAPTNNLHAATKKYVDDSVSTAKSAVIGTSSDASSANTVYGAKKYTDEAKAALNQSITGVSTELSNLKTSIGNLTNIMNFVGTTSTSLTDGATTSPITVDSKSHTPVAGDVVVSGNKEFVFTGSKWAEIGDVSAQATAITDLTQRMATAEGEIDALQTFQTNHTSAYNTLSGKVTGLETTVGNHTTSINSLNATVGGHTTDITNLKNTVGTKPSSPTMDNTLWEEVADLRSDLGESNAAAGTGSAFARIKKAEGNITSINTTIGASSDAANVSGSLYARIAYNLAYCNDLNTTLTWGSF